MKIHRRKRRWKKNWYLTSKVRFQVQSVLNILFFRVMYRKKFVSKEKAREIEFRSRLIAKVNEAKKFDAAKYVDDYLEDCRYQLVPKTYQGKRLPQWLIKV